MKLLSVFLWTVVIAGMAYAKVCPECGTENNELAKFCTHCGREYGQCGDARIQSGRGGARILLDDDYVGFTPKPLKELCAGGYQIQVASADRPERGVGWEPLHETLEVWPTRCSRSKATPRTGRPAILTRVESVERATGVSLLHHPTMDCILEYRWHFDPDWTWKGYFFDFAAIAGKRPFSNHDFDHPIEKILMYPVLWSCFYGVFYSDLVILVGLIAQADPKILGISLGINLLTRVPFGIASIWEMRLTEGEHWAHNVHMRE